VSQRYTRVEVFSMHVDALLLLRIMDGDEWTPVAWCLGGKSGKLWLTSFLYRSQSEHIRLDMMTLMIASSFRLCRQALRPSKQFVGAFPTLYF
jgi:hypothetical protein